MTRKTLTTTLAAALALTTLVTAASQAVSADRALMRNLSSNSVAASPNTNLQFIPIKLNLVCGVYGTPVEFPNDIRIWQPTGYAVPAGTKVFWKVPGSSFQGVATLPKIEPGKAYTLSNALPGGYPAGPNCQISQL